MLAHPLFPKLKALRLSGMADSLEERSEFASEQKLTPVEFLALLLDDEIDRRHLTGHWCWRWPLAASSSEKLAHLRPDWCRQEPSGDGYGL